MFTRPQFPQRSCELSGFAYGRAILDHTHLQIIKGYRFLKQHHRKGDRICLFGFSRGAYTARALAGMLYKVPIAFQALFLD